MRRLETITKGQTLVASVFGENVHFVLVHAGGENRKVWHPIQERLAMAGLGSLAYDQRGHGESSGSFDAKFEDISDDLKNIVQLQNSTQILVGSSLGGLASVLALADTKVQAKVKGLVLVDVVPTPVRARVEAFLRCKAPHLVEAPLFDDTFNCIPLLRRSAKEIEIPILLIRAGQRGAMVDADVSAFRKLCPHLSVKNIDAAGHLVAQDAPYALADALRRFEQTIAAQMQSQRSDTPT